MIACTVIVYRSRIAARHSVPAPRALDTANGFAVASVSVLRTVDGRSPRSSESDCGSVREARAAVTPRVTIAGRRSGARMRRALAADDRDGAPSRQACRGSLIQHHRTRRYHDRGPLHIGRAQSPMAVTAIPVITPSSASSK